MFLLEFRSPWVLVSLKKQTCHTYWTTNFQCRESFWNFSILSHSKVHTGEDDGVQFPLLVQRIAEALGSLGVLLPGEQEQALVDPPMHVDLSRELRFPHHANERDHAGGGGPTGSGTVAKVSRSSKYVVFWWTRRDHGNGQQCGRALV